MSNRKSISSKQWVALVVAALALAALCVVVGLSLFSQGQPDVAADGANAESVDVRQGASGNEGAGDAGFAANASNDSSGGGEQGNAVSGTGATAEAGETSAGASGAGSESASSAASGANSSSSGSSAPSGGGSSASADEPQPASAVVGVSVTIDATKGGGGSSSYSVSINAGSSVFDALRATGAAIAGSSTYVSSINGLAEFQAGPNSGWFFYVDGVRPGCSCGSYKLTGGENIVWLYVEDWTKY